MQFNLDYIPRDADEYDLKRAFANILHSDDFPQPKARVNFKIVLAKTHPGALHSGYGVLILPDLKVGQTLRTWVRNRQNVIRVGEQKRKIGVFWSDILQSRFRKYVQEAALVPFVEPEKERARKALVDRLKQEDPRFRVSAVEFGLLYRDERTGGRVFSIETSISSAAAIEFPFNERRLRAPTQIRIVLDTGGMAETYDTIILPYHTISRMEVGKKSTKHSSQSFILFELSRPPFFQQEDTWPGEHRKPKRRLATLNDEHARVAPYAHHLRVRLRDNYSHFVDFWKSLERNEPPLVVNVTPLVDPTLTPSVTEGLRVWLESVNWTIAFQLEMLLCNSLITAKQLLGDLRMAVDALSGAHGPRIVSHFLRSYAVALRIAFASGKETAMACFQRLVRELEEVKPEDRLLNSDQEAFSAHHVTLTPTCRVMEGPYPTDSNRVIRGYPDHWDHFVRVDFRDEDLVAYRLGWELDGEPFLHDCVGKVLKNGFTIAGRELQFLGYSTSSLREHSVWFMHPFTDSAGNTVDAESIRAGLGDFSHLLRKPARYAARLGQAFTATIPSIQVEDGEFEEVDDLGGHTDGCGTISRACADEIWAAICGSNPDRFRWALPPTSYQIRFKGYKGMVSVDENLTQCKMRLRPSMRKFAGSGNMLEIARYFNYPMKAYMNRPLIAVLEHRSVTTEALSELQRRAVANVHLADRDVEKSRQLVSDYGVGRAFGLPNILKHLRKLGGQPESDKVERPLEDVFMRRLIAMTQYYALVDIKNHARILLERGWLLPGVADEGPAYEARGMTGVRKLGQGEIFACVQNSPDEEPHWLKGGCIIWRNPVIHPGDLTRVRAVGKPPDSNHCFYRGKTNVVILPSVGERSLASQLAGGDVDGDLFYISQEHTIFPPLYQAPAPPDDADPARKDKFINASHVSFDDVCDFVVDYIDSNNVGLIADRHILRSDQCKDGPSDFGCMELAKLYSRAVDFPKTGTKVEMPTLSSLPIPYKPDWHAVGDEKENPELYYRSDRALGTLYRNIQIPKLDLDAHHRQRPRQLSDPLHANLSQLVQVYLPVNELSSEAPSWLWPLFKAYQNELRYVCATHAVSSTSNTFLQEEEVVLGIILDAKDRHLQKDRSQRIRTHASSLVRNVKRTLSVTETDEKAASDALKETLERAWYAWCFGVQRGNVKGDGSFGAASFGLIALGLVVDTADHLRKLQ